MKKAFMFLLLILLFTSSCFAISDIALYQGGELFATIKDNSIYDEDNSIFATIVGGKIVFIDPDEGSGCTEYIEQDSKYITIVSFDSETMEFVSESKFKRSNGYGYLIYTKTDQGSLIYDEVTGLLVQKELCWGDGNKIVSFFDEQGNIFKEEYYDGNYLEAIYEYDYDDRGNKIKMVRFDHFKELDSSCRYFYDDNGNEIKRIYYDSNNKQKYANEYQYNTEKKKIKEILYDEDNNQEYYIDYYYEGSFFYKKTSLYDYKTKLTTISIYDWTRVDYPLVREEVYDNSRLIEQSEYGPHSWNKIAYYKYDKNGNIIFKKGFDEETGIVNDVQILNTKTNQLEKWNYQTLENYGEYNLGGNLYLSDKSYFYSYNDYVDEEPITNLTPILYRTVKKCNFDKSHPGYSYLKKLIESKKYFENGVTLCNDKTQTYYAFTNSENGILDLSTCLEIKIIKKDVDYISLNKSGKGSGPFGFDIGMTYEEIKNACNGKYPQHIGDDRYYVVPAKSHSDFEKYIVWISKKYGLYYIRAIGKDVATSDSGYEIQSQFDGIVTLIEKKYGKSKKIDYVDYDYEFTDDEHWLQSIIDDARTYRARWSCPVDDMYAYNGISSISLGVGGYKEKSAYLWLEYGFLNYDDAESYNNDVF